MITKVRVGIPLQDPLFTPNYLHSVPKGTQTNHHYIYKAINPPRLVAFVLKNGNLK